MRCRLLLLERTFVCLRRMLSLLSYEILSGRIVIEKLRGCDPGINLKVVMCRWSREILIWARDKIPQTMKLFYIQFKKRRYDNRQPNKLHLSALRNTGMTNYRIDRIGTHRHASAPILTTSTRQNRSRGMKVHTPCPKKTCDYIFYNNFNSKCPISIIFGIG